MVRQIDLRQPEIALPLCMNKSLCADDNMRMDWDTVLGQGRHAQLHCCNLDTTFLADICTDICTACKPAFTEHAVPKALSEHSANAQIEGPLLIHRHGLADIDPILPTIFLLSSVIYSFEWAICASGFTAGARRQCDHYPSELLRDSPVHGRALRQQLPLPQQ